MRENCHKMKKNATTWENCHKIRKNCHNMRKKTATKWEKMPQIERKLPQNEKKNTTKRGKTATKWEKFATTWKKLRKIRKKVSICGIFSLFVAFFFHFFNKTLLPTSRQKCSVYIKCLWAKLFSWQESEWWKC